jgi:hypothetical protein
MKLFTVLSPIVFLLVVALLGFVTPGYNHLSHTISRLAIMKYGWIQTINFLQLAVGCILMGKQIATSMTHEASRRIIRIFFTFASSVLILAAVAPADPTDTFNLSLFTPAGSVHAGSVLTFMLVAPLVIARLFRALKTEPKYHHIGRLTIITGTTACVASIVWVAFFTLGMFGEYRGIFQKFIALLTFTWMMTIHAIALKSSSHHS